MRLLNKLQIKEMFKQNEKISFFEFSPATVDRGITSTSA